MSSNGKSTEGVSRKPLAATMLDRVLKFGVQAMFLIVLAIFAYSFIEVRSWTFGWYTYGKALTGVAACDIEIGGGKCWLAISDQGVKSVDGSDADGLEFRNARVDPLFWTQRASEFETSPELYEKPPWERSHQFAGTAIVLANSSYRSKLKPDYTESLKGVQIAFPIAYILLPFLLILTHQALNRKKLRGN